MAGGREGRRDISLNSWRGKRDGLPETDLAEVKPLVKDDSHVTSASDGRRGSPGDLRDSLERQPRDQV